MFGFKKRWIEVKKIPGVLKKTVFRREIFFWIRKEVFDFIPIERMNELRMKHYPAHLKAKPLKDGYLILHGKTFDADGNVVNFTRYKGSINYYKRHSYRKLINEN